MRERKSLEEEMAISCMVRLAFPASFATRAQTRDLGPSNRLSLELQGSTLQKEALCGTHSASEDGVAGTLTLGGINDRKKEHRQCSATDAGRRCS